MRLCSRAYVTISEMPAIARTYLNHVRLVPPFVFRRPFVQEQKPETRYMSVIYTFAKVPHKQICVRVRTTEKWSERGKKKNLIFRFYFILIPVIQSVLRSYTLAKRKTRFASENRRTKRLSPRTQLFSFQVQIQIELILLIWRTFLILK